MEEIEIVVDPSLDELLPPDRPGHVRVRKIPEVPGGWEVGAAVRSDLEESRLAGFREWLRVAIEQLVETGDPGANGWFPSDVEPGVWFMNGADPRLPEI